MGLATCENGRVVADVEVEGLDDAFVDARVLVRLPVVRRYCNAYDLKREAKQPTSPAATPPVDAAQG